MIVAHELGLTIPATEVLARLPEWTATVATARSRGEYVKGLAAFCGLELIEYETADVRRLRDGSFTANIRSDQWLMRQAR